MPTRCWLPGCAAPADRTELHEDVRVPLCAGHTLQDWLTSGRCACGQPATEEVYCFGGWQGVCAACLPGLLEHLAAAGEMPERRRVGA